MLLIACQGEKKNDLSGFPKLVTPYLIEEAVYNIGVDECINAVEEDGTLRTGLEWGWTSPEKLNLKAGKHTLTLRMEPDADNMDSTSTISRSNRSALQNFKPAI